MQDTTVGVGAVLALGTALLGLALGALSVTTLPVAVAVAVVVAGEVGAKLAMATLAAVLDVELRKPGAYVLNPGAGLPSVAAAERGVRVVAAGGALAFLLAGVAAWP